MVTHFILEFKRKYKKYLITNACPLRGLRKLGKESNESKNVALHTPEAYPLVLDVALDWDRLIWGRFAGQDLFCSAMDEASQKGSA